MQIQVATICDFASVRDTLITIVSAGLTRVWRSQYPAPLGVMLALIFEVHPSPVPKEVRVRVEDADGVLHAESTIGFQVGPGPGHDPGEMLTIPFVLDYRDVTLPSTGRYQIVVDPMTDDVAPTVLAFRAGFPTDPGGPQQV